ncbi:nitroreductase/quinone reductase family protein [Homoserinibacter sp. YIM 151385]|uniref:nitroreductase/quinone reductase family protein n=1 Tax=Homoserinibacter sp. YIM 151385 TaxID=2985506 RepID=UPI0022F111A4|nr:nitroreductase/quinone reductase family protein [Homoserinibacter sp. YIM 151385]WBU37999.1 nitroreductase/quinone reductase family protein [Homoserinibacter sp. YIM 151385]
MDITTTGARTGRPRRIEIWFYRVDGEVYLTTQPARRSWYANLLRHPDFTMHLTHGVRDNLPARATPVHEPAERRRIFAAIIADLDHPRHRAYIAQPVEPIGEWLARSPLMHVTFTD